MAKSVKLYLAAAPAPPPTNGHARPKGNDRDRLEYLGRALEHLLEESVRQRRRIEQLERALRDLGFGQLVRNPRGYYRRGDTNTRSNTNESPRG